MISTAAPEAIVPENVTVTVVPLDPPATTPCQISNPSEPLAMLAPVIFVQVVFVEATLDTVLAVEEPRLDEIKAMRVLPLAAAVIVTERGLVVPVLPAVSLLLTNATRAIIPLEDHGS
jgi:hypothetical protein